jgi:succinate dehydrogenase flavin-adding protein (antitoxin of CptAB toxin-antitoxin module)
MANIMEMREYDKVVRRFVDDYVNNLTPDQMREIISEQTHIDFENIRQDTGQVSVFEEMQAWDSELWIDTATHFDLPDIEDMYDE